jgi:hypothetical protein
MLNSLLLLLLLLLLLKLEVVGGRWKDENARVDDTIIMPITSRMER